MQKLSLVGSWNPNLQWETPAGRTLDRLIDALPNTQHWTLIVFGSAPLQMGIDSGFLSADVDVISEVNIDSFLKKAHLLKGEADLYVESCPPSTFTAASDWQSRAHRVTRQHVTFIFPHPVDILVSKVKRLEKKDLAAFKLVLEKTGHPTEDEMKIALRKVVDMYRPNFDEEANLDPLNNTRILWRELYEKEIDVRKEIITKAILERKGVYGPPRKLKRDL